MSNIVIYLIMGIILIGSIVFVMKSKTLTPIESIKAISRDVVDSFKKLLGQETNKEQQQQIQSEQQLLVFTNQLTSTLDACLRTTPEKYPCTCLLEKPTLFPENYVLLLLQREDKTTYFSWPVKIIDEGQRFLEDPTPHSTTQPFTFCSNAGNKPLPTPAFYFYTQDSQLYGRLSAEAGNTIFLLGSSITFYRPNAQQLCLLPPLLQYNSLLRAPQCNKQ